MSTKEQQDIFLEEIYKRHHQKLENFCLKYIGYSKEYQTIVEDSVQEAFLQAVEDCDLLMTFPPSRVEGWLMNTCWNRLSTALTTYRSRRKRRAYLPDEKKSQIPSDQIRHTVDDYIDKLCDSECLERLFGTFSKRERDIWDMRHQQGMSFEEIAKNGHTSAGAVKGVLARITAKAKKEVKDNPQKYFIFIVSIMLLNRFNK